MKQLLSQEYSLQGTINHQGTMQFGHYYSFVKDDDLWWECNDETVTQAETAAVGSEDSYILVYYKQ